MNNVDDLLPRLVVSLEGIPRNAPAIMGVSGGCDSVVLLDLLQRANFSHLIVAHFHHGLRGAAADHDAKWVRKLAKQRELCFESGRGDTRARARRKKETLEEAARTLRRAFLTRVARKHDAATVFLAHHANDVAETMLFHLARGGGMRGLSALRMRAPLHATGITIVRPLLPFTREEIENYAAKCRLTFCTDETNASPAHTRNRLRNEVIPTLATALGFDPILPMARAGEILATEDDWLESFVAADAVLPTISTRLFSTFHLAHQRRLLRAWLRYHIGAEVDFATIERARLLAISTSPPAKINLPNDHHLRRRAGKVFIEGQ